MDDTFRQTALQLIADLSAALGDVEAEDTALKKGVDAFVANARAAGDDRPLEELFLPERLAEDAFEGHDAVLERVAGASEDDVFRWRELVCDLCGY
ncbi:MAG: hypothetical protein KC586_14185 [Myxococcales bacterium]|nr:hypothetical protein [Myxococcales bacterium]